MIEFIRHVLVVFLLLFVNRHANRKTLSILDRMISRSIKSNEQRLKSLEEFEREKQEKKRLIKENSSQKSHVKFDSDDDDQPAKKFEEKKLQLFDDQELTNVEEHFHENDQPKTKRKLQNLQERLTNTNDPRFQISEQFLDEEMSFEEEKKKSLAILDQITSAKTVPVKAKPKMVRFDPTKSEHRIYEMETEGKFNGDQFQHTEDVKVNDTAPIVDSKRIYQFDEVKLKSLFDKTTQAKEKSNENGSFQFQFFNPTEQVHQPAPKVFPPAKPINNGKSKSFLNKPDETSSEEDEREESSASDRKEVKNETFFFFEIDDRLKDGLENFVRTEELDELERNWPNKRKEIAEALRTKHRKAIQRKDNHRLFKHRRRQTPFVPSTSRSKSDLD